VSHHPALPRQHRHDYAAGLHRGLPTGTLNQLRSRPSTSADGRALHPGPYPPDLSRCHAYGALPLVPHVCLLISLAGPDPSGSTRTVPALSALLPALSGVSRIGLRSAPTRPLRQPGEEDSHLLRFPAPHGAPAPRGALEQVAGQDPVGLGPEKLRPGRSGPSSMCGQSVARGRSRRHRGSSIRWRRRSGSRGWRVRRGCVGPQVGFSVARRSASARSPAGMAGRPGGRWWVVQRRATSRWCQRRIVAGVTSSPIRRWRGSRRTRAAVNARSAQDSRGRGALRWSTASCWRSTRISTSLAAPERVSSTIQLTRVETTR
jgi:hypothetical protein